MSKIEPDPLFFPTPADFRTWLEANHNTAQELWVGYYKKDSGKPSITWPESVDQALCFGWIDGIRKSIDEVSYKIRFTPRRPGSNWSLVNLNRVEELTRLNLMHPDGLRVWEQRSKTQVYGHERQTEPLLTDAETQQFRDNTAAWEWFEKQPPSYRKAAIGWVISAKQDKTRASRLARLIEDSAQGKTIPPLTRPARKSPNSA